MRERAKSNGNPPARAGTHKDGLEPVSVLAISNLDEVSAVYADALCHKAKRTAGSGIGEAEGRPG